MSKDHVALVVCGHVDAGKSTTTGRLLFELGGITERDIEKLKIEAGEVECGRHVLRFSHLIFPSQNV